MCGIEYLRQITYNAGKALKINGCSGGNGMLTCTFAGHTEVFAAIRGRLSETIDNSLIGTDEAIFYVGGRGEFDAMAANAVCEAKHRHKEKDIRLYLVEPYMRTQINRDWKYNDHFYDGIIIPEELLETHPKAAIIKRNRLMVDWSDLLIAFVYRDFGGAYQTLRYAMQKGKRIINLAEK